jgi:predicted alpha/beta superfamily hydrolase
LVQPLGAHESETLDAEAQSIAAKASIPFALAAFEISDWERDLMPWSDPAVSKRTDAECRADETLQYLIQGLLPWLKGRFGDVPVVLGGYSLAGLFSLWAARETNAFAGVAAASPSVWIRDWPNYADMHPMRARRVFLSLGEREEQTRNRAIARVGERIRNEHALLQRQLGEANCTLEWNPGGHFVDCDNRLARAFIWNLDRLKERV